MFASSDDRQESNNNHPIKLHICVTLDRLRNYYVSFIDVLLLVYLQWTCLSIDLRLSTEVKTIPELKTGFASEPSMDIFGSWNENVLKAKQFTLHFQSTAASTYFELWNKLFSGVYKKRVSQLCTIQLPVCTILQLWCIKCRLRSWLC